MNIGVVIVIVVCAVVLLVIVNLLGRTAPKGIDREHFKNEWNDIVGLSQHYKSRPLSIVHGDKLLDEALKCLGYKGETMAERLVAAKKNIHNKDEVWFAHKLRNKIVHESSFEPSEAHVQKSLKAYRSALKDLGVWK